jgi:DNA ligase 1
MPRYCKVTDADARSYWSKGMKLFSQLFHDLDSTTKTNARLDFLVNYFLEADPKDAIWVCWFLNGNRIKGALKTSELRLFASHFSGLPVWLVEECHENVGDLAETISLLVHGAGGIPPVKGLNEIVQRYIRPLVDMSFDEKRDRLREACNYLRSKDLLPFYKLLTGGFRMGISSGNLYKALASVGKVEPAFIAQKLSGNWNPDSLRMDDILKPSSDDSRLCVPFPFCLAYPLQEKPESLGICKDWQVEWKWDGIRAQLIINAGISMLWSRGDESVGHSFPEIIEASKLIPHDICLDGEIMSWGSDGLGSFSELQQRLGRKNPGLSILQRVPVRFIAYDILAIDGQDLRERPLSFRREKLEAVLEFLPSKFPVGLSPLVDEKDWITLSRLREESRERRVEGFMLKKRNSRYDSGRVKGCWYKWKVDPFLADMVLVSAQLGHGKRANLYSDYSFAVWRDGELLTVAKAYSGLKNKQIEQVDDFIRKNISGRFGPVRGVKPELVFEIAFEGVNISNRHKSGVALWFPRIKRWRKDKTANDACTLDEIRGFAGMKCSDSERDSSSIDGAGNLLLF